MATIEGSDFIMRWTRFTAVMLLLTTRGYAANSDASVSEPSGFFWDKDIIQEEVVLMVRKDGIVSGKLLFVPTEILKVEDYFKQRQWVPAQVVVFKEGRLRLREEAPLPFIEHAALFPEKTEKKAAFVAKNGRPIMAGDGDSFVRRQIRVTYRHRAGEWVERGGPLPKCQGAKLPRTLRLLNTHQPLKLVVYG